MLTCDIVTISKNSHDGIKDTLISVSCQDFENINHIIIDGKSTDSTLDIIKYFPHKKALHLFSQNSVGIARAFNEGIEKSKGSLVLFLNAGDSFIDEKVVSKIAESYIQNKWAWACGETISVSRNKYFKRHVRQYDKWEQDLFLYSNPICHQSTVFSRDLIEQVGLYNEELSLEMDYDFNIRASLISEPYLLYFPISYYDTTGVSSIQVFKHYKIHKQLRKKYFPLSRSHNLMIDSICFIKAIKRFMMIPIKLYL